MTNRIAFLLAVAVGPLIANLAVREYPLDGFERTGIRRLEAYRLVQKGEMPGRKVPDGALLGEEDIRLRLAEVNPRFELRQDTPRDPYLQEGIERIFRGRNPNYSIAILDITDPVNPRYAALRQNRTYSPGSIGKLVVTTGLFNELARLHPAPGDRLRILRDTEIVADPIIHTDSHSVPIVDLDANELVHRPIRQGDSFTLWEWVDHMVSPSSNAGGSTVWREVMYLSRFGREYPVPSESGENYFQEAPKQELHEESIRVINDPLRKIGISEEEWRQGSFFTRGGQNLVPGVSSHASPFALLKWLTKLEQGKVVDRWSSLEIKKLLYFTRRRYRYASSPALNDAAVYFKSGSLYSCQPEPDFTCRQYHGNRFNYMNSVAIVEAPAGAEHPHVYLVAMMSNVVRINSAVEHQTIATFIDRLVRQRTPEE
jgi:hypothetical protein